MTFQLRAVVTNGLRLALSRNGAVFAAVFFMLETLSLLLVLVAGTSYVPVDLGAGIEPTGGIAAGSQLSGFTGGIATMLVGVFSAVVTVPLSIIAIRTFVAGATDTIPEAALFNDLGQASVRGLVASFCYGLLLVLLILATSAGLFAVVVGIGVIDILSGWVAGAVGIVTGGLLLAAAAAVGIVIWLHFLFLLHEIGVRGQGVVDAFRGSWATVRGSRLRIGGLAFLLVSLRSGVAWSATPPVEAGWQSPPIESGWTLVQSATTGLWLAAAAAIGVVTTAILARAYRDLRADIDPDEPSGRAESRGAESPQGEPTPG